jgi:cytochrome c-type biogenesis protein CcmH
MIVFWVVAGVLSAAAAALILQSAARAASHAGSVDPTAAVFRRQLREIDDLAERGLIPEAERTTAHAEAARRLMSAADAQAQPWSADLRLRPATLAAAVLAPIIAIGLYLLTGAPGLPDQSFKARVAAWRAMEPAQLTAPQMVAILNDLIKQRGGDPEAYGYLAQAEMAAQNPSGAARALRRAIELAPDRAELWQGLGEVLTIEAGGEVSPQAEHAFSEAVKRDPKSVTARFHLARARIAAGDRAEGLAAWRALQAELPADDPRRPTIQAAIDDVERRPAPAPSLGGDQLAAVRGMVEGLAARLQTSPDDPEGWVRLVRSYAVLGEAAKRDAALAEARKRYAADPDLLKALDLAAKTEPMR